MRDEVGAVLDASADGKPLVFTQGEHQIIVGLESRHRRNGCRGEEAADGRAGGPADPDALAKVPREIIPADAQSAGQELVARSPDDSTRAVRVKEIREGTVLLYLNHPLAGMTRHFAVRVIGIDGPTSP